MLVMSTELRGKVEALSAEEIAQQSGQRPYMLLVSDTGTSAWRSSFDAEEVFTSAEVPDGKSAGLDMSLEDLDKRAMILAGRLAASVILHINGGEGCSRVGTGHENFDSTTNRRKSPLPTHRRFVITRDVQHDMREAIRDFMSGNRKTLSVQTMVTGHWRWQPFGAGRTQVKHIFIEPFWRGPEDAPIALRRHKLE
jgi:hypothetical protein